jgi:ACS family glucarate transporter-like MFS transporter
VKEPTTTRFTLLRFAFALSIVTYFDRVCISTAATAVSTDLHLGKDQMGWVFGAFTLAYAVFEIPSGRMGDRIGPRKVLTRIVLWWSAFTAATGLAWNYTSLLATRFLFGVGEAGAFPNISGAFSRWLPERERGGAHGVLFFGSRIGGALAPLLVAPLIAYMGWRPSFWIFGTLGVFWCVFWWRWFRDDPAKHPQVNEAELSVIHDGAKPEKHEALPWRKLLSPTMLGICAMYFCYGYTLYFYLTWLPTYLSTVRGFSITATSIVHAIVLLSSGVACLLGGKLTDYLVKRRGLRVGRRVAVLTMPLSGVFLLLAALNPSNLWCAIFLSLAAGMLDLGLGGMWSLCHDVGQDAAGTITGCMNMFGNFGGTLSPVVLGYLVKWYGSWVLPLMIASAVSVMCGVLMLRVDPNKRLV